MTTPTDKPPRMTLDERGSRRAIRAEHQDKPPSAGEVTQIIVFISHDSPAYAKKLAALQTERERLEREWKRECFDADQICAALGLTEDESRSEGGSLLVARIVAKIAAAEERARLERENATLRKGCKDVELILGKYDYFRGVKP